MNHTDCLEFYSPPSSIDILGPQISSLFIFKMVPIATRLILEKCQLLKPITAKELVRQKIIIKILQVSFKSSLNPVER